MVHALDLPKKARRTGSDDSDEGPFASNSIALFLEQSVTHRVLISAERILIRVSEVNPNLEASKSELDKDLALWLSLCISGSQLMKTISEVMFAVIASLLISGCGTIVNLRSGDPDVYGGVQKDVNVITTPSGEGEPTNGPTGPSYIPGAGSGSAFIPLIVAADAALSLIADTLTLPLVVYMRHDDEGIDSIGCKNGQMASPSQESTFLRKP